MKVLICNTFENKGGAAKASKRILKAIRRNDVDASYLVAYKESTRTDVLTNNVYLNKKFRFLWLRSELLPKLGRTMKLRSSFSSSVFSFGFVKIAKNYKPDILHLNYTNLGLFSIEDLGEFDIPIVWTLHDSWAFTGGCHLPLNCKKYERQCGMCPVLDSVKEKDLSRKVWERKENNWKDINITIVAPSKWIAESAKYSSLFKDRRIVVIPNPLNTTIFKPYDKEKSREELHLEKDKKYILFGAVNALKDRNKGFHLLKEALSSIKNNNCELLVFGDSNSEMVDLNIPIHNLGYISDSKSLAKVYSSADVTVIPSISENLPNTAVESISCGTPVVGFKVGGIPEIIRERNHGYIVEPYDTYEMGISINKVLNEQYDRESMHSYVIRNYGYEFIGSKYKDLFGSVLSSS